MKTINIGKNAYEWFEKRRKSICYTTQDEFLLFLLNLEEIAPVEARKYKQWKKLQTKNIKYSKIGIPIISGRILNEMIEIGCKVILKDDLNNEAAMCDPFAYFPIVEIVFNNNKRIITILPKINGE